MISRPSLLGVDAAADGHLLTTDDGSGCSTIWDTPFYNNYPRT